MSCCLEFAPGSGAAGPVVFDDFDDLYAQLQAMRAAAPDGGCYEILFNDLDAACVIPGNTYDMTQTKWVGKSDPFSNPFGIGVVSLAISADAVITGLREIVHLAVESLDPANPPITDIGPNDTFYLTDQARIFGSNVVLQFNPGLFKFSFLMIRHSSGVVQNTVTLAMGPGGNQVLVVNVDKFSFFGQNVLSGAASDSLTLQLEGMDNNDIAALQAFFPGQIIVRSRPSGYERQPVSVPVGGALVGTVNQVTTSGIPTTVDLSPAAWFPGGVVIVKNVTADPTAITITPSGAETIDGAPTLVLAAPFASAFLVSDGISNWMVI
jgi:hypothetical protein